MTLAQKPNSPEHAEPCLKELYEMADDMGEWGVQNPVTLNQPASNGTSEEKE